jgi:branched-chain amino acid transport system ATP-binding protein
LTGLLEARGLRKEFGGLVAARDVDIDVGAGEIASLIGPNGAGKTTVFNMLTGVYTPTAGRVALAGRDITAKPPHAVTEAGIGRTFQNIRLFRQMTALENVLVGMHSRTRGGILGSVLGLRRVRQEERRSRERGRELLAFVGLARHAEQYAQNLSYGDQRRLEVARALATEPRLVLLDEPTAGMNPAETAAFIGFVERIRGPEGRAVLLIEHDMKVVMGVSERVVVLDHGEKIAEGPPEEIQRNERVIEAYLGRAATA